jgi:uncharacterized membrane protein
MNERPLVDSARPTNPSVRRLRYQESVAPSLWFVPLLFVLGAMVLSRIVVEIDRGRQQTESSGWLLGLDAAASASFTSTVAAVTLSFAAVVFSTTLVAIQLAGGQYSPRVVRVFVRSRLTRVTLGIFLATFVFAISGTVEERSGDDPYVPTITVEIIYLLLAATLVAFIIFVFGISRLLRVQYLIRTITAEARGPLVATFHERDTRTLPGPPLDADRPIVRNHTRHVGVVQSIDTRGLVAEAASRDLVLALEVGAGEYVGIGTPVARVIQGDESRADGDWLVRRLVLGAERTTRHDPGFVFRQLVDIAIRALSPAVNDPTTAVQCIDRLADLLGDIATANDPSGWFHDDDAVVRVHQKEPGLDRLIELAFVEIIRYGADSPQVVRRLHAAFDVLEPLVRPDVAATVQRLRRVLDGLADTVLPPGLTELSRRPDRHGLG